MTARGQDAAARASAAVFVGGHEHEGSAVLVGAGELLTAGHVLWGLGPADQITVEFPAPRPGERLRARAVPGAASDGPEPDVALLELLDPPSWLPDPIDLWPARRPPREVVVFGFPVEERALRGLWRSFDVAGGTAGGPSVQLRWRDEVGTLPGQSGGPVLDVESGTLAGVLVEGSSRGRFDRYVPVAAALARWPRLARPWMFAGPDGRDHFHRRARGRHGDRRDDVDLFRGRTRALDAVRAWLARPDPPGVPLVVTGAPGAGKSSVLARSVLVTSPPRGDVAGVAFHARGATHDDLVTALAALTGAPEHATRREVLAALDDAGDGAVRWIVALDALDEAAADLRELARTLREVAALDSVRVVVATRRREPMDPGRAEPAAGSLLSELAVDDDSLVDLDSDRYFEPDGLVAYVEALLAHPGPQGRAWERYRDDAGLRGRLARVVAERAARNHLVAVMAADPLARQRHPVDPVDPDFDPALLPTTVGDALESYLDALPAGGREQRRGVLAALACARGDGLDDALWLAFASAVGYPTTHADLDELRRSPAADYLLHTVSVGGRRLVRLFHQALVEQLRVPRDRAADEAALVAVLEPMTAAADRPVALAYALGHLGEHAAAAGLLPRVLRNTDYVVGADLDRLMPLLRAPGVRDDHTAVVLRRASARAQRGRAAQRAQVLALGAAHLGFRDVLERCASRCEGLRPRWAHTLGVLHEELVGHVGAVHDVAFGTVAGDRVLLASGGADGTLRLWDPAVGSEVRVLTGHEGAVRAVTFGELADGRTVLASGGEDGVVRIWDAVTGAPLHALTDRYTPNVRDVVFGRLPDGRDVLAVGDAWGASQWDPVEGTLRHHLARGRGFPGGSVAALALGRLAGRTVCVTVSAHLQFWDLEHGDELKHVRDTGSFVWSSMAAGRSTAGRDLVALGGASEIVLWSPDADRAVLTVDCRNRDSDDRTRRSWVRGLAFGTRPGGRSVLASASYNGVVQLWDPEDGSELRTLTGHDGPAHAVAFGRDDHARDLLASASADGTVRLWDLAGSADDPSRARPPTVVQVAIGRLATGEVVVASAERSGAVRLWAASDGTELRTVRIGSDVLDRPGSVAFGRDGDGRTVLAVNYTYGSAPGTRRGDPAWQAVTLLRPDDGTDVAVLPVDRGLGPFLSLTIGARRDGAPVVAGIGSSGYEARVWDPRRPRRSRVIKTRKTASISVVPLDDGRVVLASGDDVTLTGPPEEGLVRLWDLDDGREVRTLQGLAGAARAVTVLRSRGRSVLAAAGDDGTVRLWDPSDGTALHVLRGHVGTVRALSSAGSGGGPAVLASGGDDGTVRLWDPADGSERAVVRMFGPVRSVALGEGYLAAVAGTTMCVFALSPPL